MACPIGKALVLTINSEHVHIPELAFSLPGIYTQEKLAHLPQETWIRMFAAAVSLRIPHWKTPNIHQQKSGHIHYVILHCEEKCRNIRKNLDVFPSHDADKEAGCSMILFI